MSADTKVYLVPRRTRQCSCRCGAVIYFVRLPSDKLLPVQCHGHQHGQEPTHKRDGYGVNHYTTCGLATTHGKEVRV